jgi:TonB family protein
MKYFICFLCISCLTGCYSIQQTTESIAPQLMLQSPLPEFPESIKKPPTEISAALHILENGMVDNVKLLKSSGSQTWDSLAATIMMKWRFSPAQIESKPVSTWFHMRAPLHYAKPVIIYLAQIVCATKETADTVYNSLKSGQDFNDLYLQYSIDTLQGNRGVMGPINIYSYQENIRDRLTDLDEGDYTNPLKFGEHFIIFKRLKD